MSNISPERETQGEMVVVVSIEIWISESETIKKQARRKHAVNSARLRKTKVEIIRQVKEIPVLNQANQVGWPNADDDNDENNDGDNFRAVFADATWNGIDLGGSLCVELELSREGLLR